MVPAKKRLWTALAVWAAGMVFQWLPVGCRDYGITSALTAFNFCSIFNCEAGTYFDLCSPFPLLVDCPQIWVATGQP